MKPPMNWLELFPDLEWSPAEPADRLTMLGIQRGGKGVQSHCV